MLRVVGRRHKQWVTFFGDIRIGKLQGDILFTDQAHAHSSLLHLIDELNRSLDCGRDAEHLTAYTFIELLGLLECFDGSFLENRFRLCADRISRIVCTLCGLFLPTSLLSSKLLSVTLGNSLGDRRHVNLKEEREASD